jgi:hypothetical protein
VFPYRSLVIRDVEILMYSYRGHGPRGAIKTQEIMREASVEGVLRGCLEIASGTYGGMIAMIGLTIRQKSWSST